MTRRRLALAAVSLVLSALVACPVAAFAAGAPTKITMDKPTELKVKADNPEVVMVLGATITTADGKPVSNQKVEFLMGTDLLGKKWASIGTVASDSSGSARTTFVVTRTGAHEFSARFAGTDAFGPSEAAPVKADLVAAAESAHEGTTLPLIGRWVPWTGLAMGVAVWLTLIYVMARVLVIVPRAARRAGN